MKSFTLTTLSLLLTAVLAANEISLKSYQFDGQTFSGDVTIKNLGFEKSLALVYADAAKKWGNVCNASYKYGPFDLNGDNVEVWSFFCDVRGKGVTEFYAEYTVGTQKYYGNFNNVPGANFVVKPSPAANAGSTGFQSDISEYFKNASPLWSKYLLQAVSVNAPNVLPGTIIAAPYPNRNNYFFHWIRDGAMVMDVIAQLYKDAPVAEKPAFEKMFADFQSFSRKTQTTDASRYGDAKWNLNGSPYTGPWCNPQNDGPALRATSFMKYARTYLANGGSITKVRELYSGPQGVIKPDLDHVAKVYNLDNGCDLWEEQRGAHFFTVATQRRSLAEGAEFARFMNDTDGATYYAAQSKALDTKIATFWNVAKQLVQTTLGARYLDAAVPLGSLHGSLADGVFGPGDDRILNTVYLFEQGFVSEYPLSSSVKADSSSLALSVPIGRYAGDKYTGNADPGTNLIDGAGPWFLTTAAVAEVAYKAAKSYILNKQVTVTALNRPLFNGPQPAGLGLSVPLGTFALGTTEFQAVVQGLQAYADKHIRRVKTHGQANYRLSEQYSRVNGAEQGVSDLTWSYAALLTAGQARRELASLSNGLFAARR
ncbi:glycoside hydrolase 15 protein [Chytridiales sp. JEL 0842]|nr:glycoside hydrolase 15 protein [Chytridiales sp. JEL 0842]